MAWLKELKDPYSEYMTKDRNESFVKMFQATL